MASLAGVAKMEPCLTIDIADMVDVPPPSEWLQDERYVADLDESGQALALLSVPEWPPDNAVIEVHEDKESWLIKVNDQAKRFSVLDGLGNVAVHVEPAASLVWVDFADGSAIWNYRSGDLIHEVQDIANNIAVATDVPYLGVSDWVGRVSLFDLETGTPIGELPISPNWGSDEIMFGSGGSLAAVDSEVVNLWTLDPEGLVKEACRIAGRGLSEAETRVYLSETYQNQEPCR